jgi:amidophosphoribosyltransferase
VRFANVYGIDMPTRAELIASDRSDEQIRCEIGADALIYQDLEDLKAAVRTVNPAITQFEASCFDGHYITGDISSQYLSDLECTRSTAPKTRDDDQETGQLDLNLDEGD